jgi:hypothetical protein
MQPTRRRTVRTTPPSRVDQAAALLSRLVSDSRGWDADTAARDLSARLADEWLLRQLRARVVQAMLRLPLPSDARALATLDLALAPHGTSRAAA